MIEETRPSPGRLMKKLTGFLRTYRAFVSGLAVMACAIAPAPAQPGPSPEAVIASFISDPFFGSFFQELSEHNPDVAAMHARWQEATARAGVADALPDPRLSAGLYLQEVETRVGPQRYRLGISQSLPWKGKLPLKQGIAEATAAALYERYLDKRQTLFAAFKQNLAQLRYLSRSIRITGEHVVLLQELEAQMESRYVTDKLEFSDWVRIQVEVERLRDRLTTLREMKRPVEAELNRLLGRPIDRPFAVDFDSLPELPKSLPIDRAGLIEAMKRNNHMLQSSDRRIAAANKGRELARKDFYPDFTVGLDFIETGSARMDGVEDSGKDPVILKFGMSIPLFKKKYRALETAAGEAYVSAVKDKASQSDGLAVRIDRLLYEYEDAVRKVKLYEKKLIPDTRDALDVMLRSYEAGASGFLDLIDTERTLLTLQLAMVEARNSGYTALAGLEEITVTPLWGVRMETIPAPVNTETPGTVPTDVH